MNQSARPRRDYDAEGAKFDSFCRAMGILRAAAQANAGCPIEYLRGRGITAVPDCVQLLPANDSMLLTGKRYPAMVVPIISAEGSLQGAQITWLDSTGRTKLAVSDGSARRSYGELKGGHVPLGAFDPNKPVIVAEGVEDALSVVQVTGLPAIATLGAENMRTLPTPVGSEVIIAADNDEKGTGIKAAEEFAERITIRSGRPVRIALPQRAEGQSKRDWNDALMDAGSDKDKLTELRDAVLGARLFRQSQTDWAGYALSMEDVLSLEVPPRQYLLEPWLETGSMAMIYGKRGSFKTRLAMSVGYAIATGQPLLGWKVRRQARVLYVDGELPTALLQKRLQLLGTATPNLIVVSGDIMLRTRGRSLPDLGQQEGRDFLDKIIEATAAEVVILDSLSTTIQSGIENDAESWAPIQAWMLQHRFRERTIILLHHEGRSGNARGTTKREDTLDTIMRLRERKDTEDVADKDRTDEGLCELTWEKSREFHGADAVPLLLKLSIKSGVAEWNQETLRDSIQARIRELFEQGLEQKEIVKALGVSKGWVSKVIKKEKAREERPREENEMKQEDEV
jgi:putative DNA primase/helicase